MTSQFYRVSEQIGTRNPLSQRYATPPDENAVARRKRLNNKRRAVKRMKNNLDEETKEQDPNGNGLPTTASRVATSASRAPIRPKNKSKRPPFQLHQMPFDHRNRKQFV